MSFLALSAVRGVRGISPTARLVLFGLAQYAGPDGLCHPSQDTLADDLGLSRKSVMRAMTELKNGGLIATARRCRKNGSRTSDQISLLYFTPAETPEPDARLAESRPRSRPVKSDGGRNDQGTDCPLANQPRGQTQQGVEAENDQGTDCPIAKGTDWPGLRDSLSHPTTFEPVREPIREIPDGISSERERARVDERDVFAEALAIYPASGAGVTDEGPARESWAGAAAEAGGEDRLLAAVRAYAADPSLKRRDFGAPSMQRWLSGGRWRAWLGQPERPTGTAPAPTASWDGPPEIRAALAEALGEAFAAAYLDPARWDAARRCIIARTGVARDRLQREARAVLAASGLSVATVSSSPSRSSP